MQAHMVSLFKEQIFVFHAISELFPSEISSFNLMQNMPGCHCRELADLTNLQKQCSFAQYNAPQVHVHGQGLSHQQVRGSLREGHRASYSVSRCYPESQTGVAKEGEFQNLPIALPLPLEWEPLNDSVSKVGALLPQTLVRGDESIAISSHGQLTLPLLPKCLDLYGFNWDPWVQLRQWQRGHETCSLIWTMLIGGWMTLFSEPLLSHL